MSNKRKDAVYQTLITDLTLLGYLTKEEGEALLGYKIPAHLRLPKEAERFQVEDTEEDDTDVTTSTVDAADDDTTSTDDE